MLASQTRAFQPAAASSRAFRPARIAPICPSRVAPRFVCEAAAVDAPVAAPKQGVAHLNYQRGSVFKVRRVLDTIRGRSYEEALILMEYMPYRACEKILKCLLSAAENAKNNQGASKSTLVVSEAFANQGPVMKRFRPRAQGRGYKILKPTFHLTIKVETNSA